MARKTTSKTTTSKRKTSDKDATDKTETDAAKAAELGRYNKFGDAAKVRGEAGGAFPASLTKPPHLYSFPP